MANAPFARALCLALPLVAAIVLVLGGCVTRRIVVTSEPPGASVWVNDQQIGRTPAEVGFDYFGMYDVRLRLDGYEPITTKANASAPIYEYPPFDVVAEALPGTRETVITWHYVLKPALELQGDPREQERALIGRAKELGAMIPPPPAPAPATEPPAPTAAEPAASPAVTPAAEQPPTTPVTADEAPQPQPEPSNEPQSQPGPGPSDDPGR